MSSLLQSFLQCKLIGVLRTHTQARKHSQHLGMLCRGRNFLHSFLGRLETWKARGQELFALHASHLPMTILLGPGTCELVLSAKVAAQPYQS